MKTYLLTGTVPQKGRNNRNPSSKQAERRIKARDPEEALARMSQYYPTSRWFGTHIKCRIMASATVDGSKYEVRAATDTEGTGGQLFRKFGKDGWEPVGYVMNALNPDALEYAIDVHREEMAALVAEARAEFGGL